MLHRWLLCVMMLAGSLRAQSLVEAPVQLSAFLGIARGANEVPAALQRWDVAGGFSALVRERDAGTLGGELSFWYARTSSSQRPYATGMIMVDARGRLMLQLSEQTSLFVSAGVGALFPINERVLQQPASPDFEANMPALCVPVGFGVHYRLTETLGVEARLTYVLTTSDNLNAPHDGTPDGALVISVGATFRLGY